MRAEDFQLVDDEKTDDSVIKREFIKTNHQSAANVDQENSNIKFYFGENQNFIQAGIGYLEFDIKIRKADNNSFDVAIIAGEANVINRLVSNAFAYTIHDVRIPTSTGVAIEQNKLLGPIFTIIRLVTKKMTIYLHILINLFDENEDGINHSSLKQIIINNHIAENRGVIYLSNIISDLVIHLKR